MDSRAQKLGAAFRAGVAFYRGRALAQDAAQWITVHPHGKGLTAKGEKAKGQPVLIDGQTGEVLGGMGGKFKGRHISAVRQNGKFEQHGAQQAIDFYKSRESIEAARKAKEEKAKSEQKNVTKPGRAKNFFGSIFTEKAERDIKYAKDKLNNFNTEERVAKYLQSGLLSEGAARAQVEKERQYYEGQVKSAKRALTAAQNKDKLLYETWKELNDPSSKKYTRYYWEEIRTELDRLFEYDLDALVEKTKREGKSQEDAEKFAFASLANQTDRALKAIKELQKNDAQYDNRDKAKEVAKINAERFKTQRSYTDSAIGQRFKQIFEKHRDNLTETAAQEAGALAFDGFAKLPVLDQYNNLQNELENLDKETHKAWSTPDPADRDRAVQGLWARKSELREKSAQLRGECVKAVASYVSQIRQLSNLSDKQLREGLSVKKKTPANSAVIDAQKCLPKEWVDAFMARGALKTVQSARGYFRPGRAMDDEMAISGSTEIESLRCAIHELGHRLEASNPQVLALEKEFYERRTAGESLESLQTLTGNSGYSIDERSRRDKFLDAYMGKDYGGNAYELVSMGLEMLYTEPYELVKDPDYAKFILGIVTLT